ncbi:hypothetical protein BGZ72_009511 [Mortierella alpina]|nr:hypothetical protein BGZ72_009511 [Mortierella alpina]
MTVSDSVLLPKLFPKDLVSLGQLLRNPLVPNIDTFRGGCALVSESDISAAEPEENYEAIVSVGKKGWFDFGLIGFLSTQLGGRKTNMLSIKAKSLEYSALKDSGDVLRRISSSDEAKKWIDDMVRYKTSCYLVIGIQTLCVAEFTRVVLKEGVAGGYITVPLEPNAQVLAHVKGNASASQFGSSVGNASGVFGIQVLRLDPRIVQLGAIGPKSEVSWKWTYQNMKGAQQQEEEERLDITLEAVAMDELSRLRMDAEEEEDD